MSWIDCSSSWWGSRGDLPASTLLSRSAARRADEMTKYCAHVIEELGAFSKTVPIVYGSCLGSVSVVFLLLDELSKDELGLSPIQFSGSVHHAPISALGVSNQHTGIVTAVSANQDLSAVVMIEALDLAKSVGEVLVVISEETWPRAFGAEPFEPYAAALQLTDSDPRQLVVELSDEPFENPLGDNLRGNPAANLQIIIDWSDTASAGDFTQFASHTLGGSWIVRCK